MRTGPLGIGIAAAALALTVAVRANPAAREPGAARAAAQPPAAAGVTPPANDDCQACHDDDGAERADGSKVVVKTAVFAKSTHAEMACVDCHADLAAVTDYPHAEKLAKVDCATCHGDQVAEYRLSAHAAGRANGKTVAATCVDCHGTHDMRGSKDPAARTYHLTVAATCAKCHGNAEIIAKGGIPSDVTKAFSDSIHGRALSKSGLLVAPTCSDCHGAHDIRKPKDPVSHVASTNVPKTCGKCHEGIERRFEAGVHGQTLAKGNGGAPACQTCHTAHDIQRAETIGWQLSVIGQCGTCHAEQITTFRDTFHGQVTNLGFRSVAGCADCHGAHEILPASDSRSPISPGRLVETCGKCHENANENFVKYDPHADKHSRERSPALFYTAKFMTVLLAGTFGFFGLHTTLWFSKELRVRRSRRAAAVPRKVKGDS